MTTTTTKTVLIAAGGTGGHVFPALATATELRSRGYKIQWVGSKGRIEEKLVPQAGIELKTISVDGLRGKSLSALIVAPWKLVRALWQSYNIVKEVRPDLVIGMGGFVSGPVGLAAFLQRIPLVIHEQNAIAGMTNKILAKMATRVLEAYKGTFRLRNVYATGNPVRANLKDINHISDPMVCHILVIGGSLGAQVFNEKLPEFFQALQAKVPEVVLKVVHQTGRNQKEIVEAVYVSTGLQVKVLEFIDDMAAAYQKADIVISRAGALTIAELVTVGVPSVLIPYPHAVDDHQTFNAQPLVNAGAAEMIPQSMLTQEVFINHMKPLVQSLEKRQAMQKAALSLAQPHATQDIVAHCIKVME